MEPEISLPHPQVPAKPRLL